VHTLAPNPCTSSRLIRQPIKHFSHEEETSGKRELKLKGKIGEVLIRCNNVLYIRQADNMGQTPNEEGEMAE